MVTITNEQKELLTTLMENKDNLEELFKIASMKRVSGKDIKIKESIEIAGITWNKFAEDENGNAYMLADTVICKSKFGENNNWIKSCIRNDILQNLYIKMVKEIGSENMILFKTDLFSHDGLRDYGEVEERISILTYDLYRNNRENIKQIDEWYWLATPNSTPSGYGSDYVRCVGSVGCVSCDWCNCVVGVRPFFILKAERSDA